MKSLLAFLGAIAAMAAAIFVFMHFGAPWWGAVLLLSSFLQVGLMFGITVLISSKVTQVSSMADSIRGALGEDPEGLERFLADQAEH